MTTSLLAVFLTLLIVILFVGGIVLASILFLSRDTTKIPELLSRVANIETTIGKLAADVKMEIDGPASQEIWRSADGKYTANSFEELLSVIASDPSGPLSDDEISAIKSAFEKIMQDPNNDTDEPPEPWRNSI